jgi:hypothetical protein
MIWTAATSAMPKAASRRKRQPHTGLIDEHTRKRRITMPNASKKHVGAGARGKKSGTGATTDIPKDKIEENMVLSNRDKSRHSGERGLDSKLIQTEQLQDHAGNRLVEDEEQSSRDINSDRSARGGERQR